LTRRSKKRETEEKVDFDKKKPEFRINNQRRR
jgi:hypothetical protein